MLRDSQDIYLSLLIYRTTPLPWCNLSPAELLMGRKLKANLPLWTDQLTPTWSYLTEFREQDAEFKRKQKRNFDRRHKAKSLPLIPDSSEVWITSNRSKPIKGRVARQVENPRSYEIETEDGETVRRNRYHLNLIPYSQESGNALQDDSRAKTSTSVSPHVSPPQPIAS